jgi:ABC-type glycerol-3-phosphate transport system permease component
LCSLGGYAFAKYTRAPGHNKLFVFVLGTMMIPGAVTLIPVFMVLCKLHMVNTYWAIIIPGAANAFGIFWMRQYIGSNLPSDLIDAARIDGCGEFGIYWRIALPVARPALAALGILFLIGIWNNLMWAYIVLRTEDMYTLPLMIYLLNGELRTPYELIMASGLVATLPLVIAFLLFQKHFIQGIMAGSIKA